MRNKYNCDHHIITKELIYRHHNIYLREMYFGTFSQFSIVVADLTNVVVADLTAVAAELTAVVAELDVADSSCRRVGCRRPDLSPS